MNDGRLLAERRPRVACLGLGWIGQRRLQSLLQDDIVDVVALADVAAEARERAGELARDAALVESLDEALSLDPDGVVLATPSAMHAAQAMRALEAGVAVFCQKPLGRNAAEVDAVVDTARRTNRLLAVDVSYRHTAGLSRMRDLVRRGAIGRVYAVDLTFHNAYGPDKPWFYDAAQSGGGCLLDLGVHLVDFLYWTFDAPVVRASAHLLAAGQKLTPGAHAIEDYVTAELELGDGIVARLACSWKLPLAVDAEIAVSIYGTEGGLHFRNVNGSFYDFAAEWVRGGTREALCAPPDEWGGRAIVAWAQQLARSPLFDPAIDVARRVAVTLDRLYGRADATLDEFPLEEFEEGR